jgi:hypothetical protein
LSAAIVAACPIAPGLVSAPPAAAADDTIKRGVVSVNDAEHGFEKR